MLTKITSADNNRLKLVRKLASRKGRLEEHAFIAEGRNLVSEMLEKNIRPRFILVSDKLSDDGLIKEAAAARDTAVCIVPEREFSKLTDAGHGVGMLAVADMPEPGHDALDSLDEADNILILDRVQDPGNMGTLIRTSAAAGYKLIIAVKGTVDVYSPKVLRATAGTLFELPVIYADSADDLSAIVKSTGKKMVVTDVTRGVPYYEAGLSEGIALVIGNEGSGVSEEIKAMADVRVTIPMKGHIESLNAAVAAAILMYESVRN